MADNGPTEAQSSTEQVVHPRDVMDILKELHITLEKSIKGQPHPLAETNVEKRKELKRATSAKAAKVEQHNPIELFTTLQRQIDELESAFENIAAQTLVKKICKEARHSLSDAHTFLIFDARNNSETDQQRREHARVVYAKVWKEMQFLARFLCDVQPLGTTTEIFYDTTMKRHYGIGYIDPRLITLPFGGLSNRQLMWPPNMLVEYLYEFNDFIKYFLKRGIALLESEQNYLRDKYTNIATIATFFSSITASTLQFSFDQGTSTLWVTVNTLWFLSLVSSIASAANALLAITWHKSLSYAVRKLQSSIVAESTHEALNRAEKDSEEKKRTKTLDRWFDSCPMAFLVASGALFMVGLVIFTYASLQHPVTQIMVLTLVSCHALCTSRLFVELLAVRWGELKGYVEKPINNSFSLFLESLLKILRFTSAPLFFIFDLFSLKGWKLLDSMWESIQNLFSVLT